MRALLPALAAAVLAACMASTDTGDPPGDGPSTETGNPALAGTLRDAAGLPAAGARVLLLRLSAGGGDSAALRAPARVDSAVAGIDGAYRFDSLAAGAYAVEASDTVRGLLALLPRAEIPEDTGKFLRKDTLVLKPPATLSGTVRRDDNPKPVGVLAHEGILVRVAGTERAAYTDTAGRYVLGNVPEGSYRVAFAAADGHYLPGKLDPVAAPAGAVVQLPLVVLAWSPVVAPPSPAGLSAIADSASGTMRLAWRPVRVSNFSHYEIVRDAAPEDTSLRTRLRSADTVFVDTLSGLAPGSALRYQVLAVNLLGSKSPEDAARRIPATVPLTEGPGGSIAVVVLRDGKPADALVRLYAIPSEPGPADSLPRGVRPVDSLRTSADGGARFPALPAGAYTATAESRDLALLAARVGLRPRASGQTDTLRLAAAGRLEGRASRQQLWCSNAAKLDEYIEVSLAGMPNMMVTDYSGEWSLSAVPAGSYRLVVQALPTGCFMPDTVAVVVVPGGASTLPLILAGPNPGFIPKVSGLRISSTYGARVSLAWIQVSGAYTDLLGYEVIRRDRNLEVMAVSTVLAGASYVEDLTGLPSGTEVSYVVRVVTKAGLRGPFGGDGAGLPAYFTVP